MKLITTILTFIVFTIAFTNVSAQNVTVTEEEEVAEDDPKNPTTSNGEEHTSKTLINDVLFSIGFNLNLIATTQTSGLYYDVNTFIPSLDSSKVGRNLGLDLRFNQGTFIPKSYGQTESTSYSRVNNVNDDGLITILRQDYVNNVSKVESYLALSISPTWKIKDGFPLFFVAHLEFLRKTTDFITNNEITSEVNLQVAPDRVGDYTLRNRRITGGEHVSTTNDHLFNGGVGLKFYKNINGVTVNLKMIAGIGTNPDISITSSENADRNKNGSYYLTHFEVAERKYGIKLGGEIRGLRRPKNYNELHPLEKRGYEPYSNIYIAKIFKFSKISDLITL